MKSPLMEEDIRLIIYLFSYLFIHSFMASQFY